MVRFLQANLNHCGLAQDLLSQRVRTERTDVVLVSDPHMASVRSPEWLTSAGSGRAAIWVVSDNITVADVTRDTEFVTARLCGIQVISCYVSPSLNTTEFDEFLLKLSDKIRSFRRGTPILVAGDFNARAAAWGDWITNARGSVLCSLLESHELVILNEGSTPTFRRGRGSVIDITLVNEGLTQRVSGWKVLEDEFNGSDHNYLQFSVDEHGLAEFRAPTGSHIGWNVIGGVNLETLKTGLLLAEWLGNRATQPLAGTESQIAALETRIAAACDFALPKKPTARRGKPPLHWWNGEIAQLRQMCQRKKRAKTRINARIHHLRDRAQETGLEFDEQRADITLNSAVEELRAAKRELKKAIRRSKAEGWKELVRTVDEDPFGKPYKVVMKKLCGPPAISRMENETLQHITSTLFPVHPPLNYQTHAPIDVTSELFSRDEVNNAVFRIGCRKTSPGPDGINTKIIDAIHKIQPELLLNTYNRCLTDGVFPAQWKKARVVLIRKNQKPENVPSSYRPLCLLNDMGKVLEYLLSIRLKAHVDATGGLSANQFGFRKGRSTDDAVTLLHRRVVAAKNVDKFCVAIAIDIKNAFNSIGWRHIMGSLRKWNVPMHLLRMFESYFKERRAYIDSMEITVSGGVPQGSVVGPMLWNLTYDEVLSLQLEEDCELIGFADDTLVVVSAKNIPDLEERANRALRVVADRVNELGLEIEVNKTEVVLFTNKNKYTLPRIHLNETPLEVKNEMSYLGIVVSKTLLYKSHINRAAEKAERILTQLSRIMPNIGGPREARRKLLIAVVQSVLLYGAPTWAHTLPYVPANVAALNRVQRRALLRSICGYRTVSEVATNILAAVPPADLLAREREEEFLRRRNLIPDEAEGPNNITLLRWMNRIADATTGEWTRTLVVDLPAWYHRKHGQMDYHLTQIMSGHGCFGKYLHRIGKEPNPGCHHCELTTVDDALHTMAECTAWAEERNELTMTIGPLDTNSLIRRITEDRVAWDAFSKYIHAVMTKKENAERERESAGR